MNLKTDKALRGVMWAKSGPLLILRQAVLIEAGRSVPIDGEVLVERSNVDFIQALERLEAG